MITIESSTDNIKKDHIDQVNILKQLDDITAEDIDNLLSIVRGNKNNDTKYDDKINKYLSIVDQVFRGNSYLSLGDTVETRRQRYEIYDEMDESTSYISAALDILSDDATQIDESGNIINIVCENSKVKSIVEELFSRIDVESKLGKWARAIAKYGDFFVKINVDGNIINRINDTIYPSSIERRDLEGKLIAFCDSTTNIVSDNIYTPWEYIHFRLKGDIYRSQMNNRVSALEKDSISYNLTSSYGQSILRPAIKVYAQLRFVENLIILSRLTNSIKRNIFLINTGETDPSKAYETIRNYANLLKKDISLDIERGIYNAQRHTITYDEDIFIPVNDTKNDVRIESIGGDVNIAEQYDLEYLLNKLFSALKIPKAYLNYEQDLNARSTLIQLDIRYARSVSQIQVSIIGGLLRLAKIQLSYLGIDPDTVDLDIKLTSVSSIDKEARLEQQKVSLDSARALWDMAVIMNDKLAEIEKDNKPLNNPLLNQQEDANIPNTPTDIDSNDKKKKSPINLEYFAEEILSKYFEFDEDVINKLMYKKVEKNESKKINLNECKYYPNSDIHEMYPTPMNIDSFKTIKESILIDVKDMSNI